MGASMPRASSLKITLLVLYTTGMLLFRHTEAVRQSIPQPMDKKNSDIKNQLTDELSDAHAAAITQNTWADESVDVTTMLQTPALGNESPLSPPPKHEIVGLNQSRKVSIFSSRDDGSQEIDVRSRWFPTDLYAAKLKELGLLAESAKREINEKQFEIIQRVKALLSHVSRFGNRQEKAAEGMLPYVAEKKRTKRSWSDFLYDYDDFFPECGYPPCPVWTEWHGTGMCNVTCGGGKRLLVRYCNNSNTDEFQGGCEGESTKIEECNTNPCPSWSEWTAEGQCSSTCGEGIQKYRRNCLLNGKTAQDCHGLSTEFRACSTIDSCPPQWTKWSKFGACSKTCGEGFQVRRRLCVVNGVLTSGRKTPCQGNSAHQRPCAAQPRCRARFSQWSTWSHCDAVTCDAAGFERRTRKCLEENGEPLSKYRMNCKPGQLNERRRCRAVSCAVAWHVVALDFAGEISAAENYKTTKPTWSQWTKWSSCSVSCGLEGRQTRSRMCFGVQIDQENSTVVVNKDKTCPGKPIETRDCHYDVGCPHWDSWQKWGGCSRSCGLSGKRTRARICIIEVYGRFNAGKQIESTHIFKQIENHAEGSSEGSGDSVESVEDWQRDNLPRATLFSGGGDLYRKERNLLRTVSLNLHWCEGGSNASTTVSRCNEHHCPPKWDPWQAWSGCSATCGKGQMQRSRRCLGKGDCYGNKYQFKDCYQPSCWSEWSSYTPCTKSCDSGVMTRYRRCLGTSLDVAAYRGCEGPQQQNVTCNEQKCPRWAGWTAWGNCSALCGFSGNRVRTRECVQRKCKGPNTENDICNYRPCPYWGQWSIFSCCSTSCGDGVKTRSRICRHGEPGVEGCHGQVNDEQPCNPGSCNATTLPSLDSLQCGVKPQNKTKFILKIFNGEVSDDHEWPWQASWQHYTCVGRKDSCKWEHLCGATLISPKWVVTAGHCIEEWTYRVVYDDPSDSWSVVVGMTRLHRNGDRFYVRRVLLHKDYDYTAVPQNDIALLKLRRSVPISDLAMPACLPENHAPAKGEECFVTGWGNLHAKSSLSPLLRETAMPIMDFGECQKLGPLYKNYLNPDWHMCAGKVNDSKASDSCRGDSGGPMVCKRPDGKWYLAAITSFGFKTCGTPGAPGIYLPLSKYENWVTHSIEKYSRNGC